MTFIKQPIHLESTIAQAWQDQLHEAAHKPCLASMLLKPSPALYDRFANAYRHLLGLSRQRRRRILRKLGKTLAGAALALALSLSSMPVAHAANLTVTTSVPAINADGSAR